MSGLLVLGVLVLAVVVLTPAADRWGVPQPVLLTVFGLAFGLLPQVTVSRVSPDLILPLVLPPLLFAATQNTSVRDLRAALRPVLGLAVGLTLLTATLVAVVGHALGLSWAVASVLGAIVAPPDPVAATAVAGRLHLPARLVTVLEGEGQFNDATALVAYQLSVMAVLAGGVSAGEIGWGLVVAVLGGSAIGVVGGWLARWALGHLHDPATETTVTVAAPFAVYLLAEHLGASGVLAVLGTGLFLRARTSGQVTSGGWLLGKAVWRFVDFLVSGLVFAFLGLELTSVLRSSPELGRGDSWVLIAAVLAVLVGTRGAAMFAAAAVRSHRATRRSARRDPATPRGWREAAVTSWAGMRGVVTVATALALPFTVDGGGPFPSRDVVVFVALVVVIVTLVFQGLTLAPLIRRLGVAAAGDTGTDVRRLQHLSTAAALEELRTGDEGAPPEVVNAVLRQYESRLDYRQDVRDLVDGSLGGDEAGPHLRRLLSLAGEAEREAVLAARRRGEVSDEAAEVVLFDIESRALRYDH